MHNRLVHSIAEACEAADTGRTALYEAINSGDLRAVKRGRRTLILADDLHLWVRSLPTIKVKSMPSAGGIMTEETNTDPGTTITETKFTAEQIETNCPDQLQRLGKEIAARIRKADKQLEQAENHAISVNQLIAEAKELCDGGGFHAFQKKFFPDLNKSRAYELLAIGTNKKSVEEIRADTRARVAKHRASKAAAPNSVTVTENAEPDAQVALSKRRHGSVT